MTGLEEKSTVSVGEINYENKIRVSKEIATAVKLTTVNGNTVPLFPTKRGFEYFVFRT